jgi:hypothetical protein
VSCIEYLHIPQFQFISFSISHFQSGNPLYPWLISQLNQLNAVCSIWQVDRTGTELEHSASTPDVVVSTLPPEREVFAKYGEAFAEFS